MAHAIIGAPAHHTAPLESMIREAAWSIEWNQMLKQDALTALAVEWGTDLHGVEETLQHALPSLYLLRVGRHLLEGRTLDEAMQRVAKSLN